MLSSAGGFSIRWSKEKLHKSLQHKLSRWKKVSVLILASCCSFFRSFVRVHVSDEVEILEIFWVGCCVVWMNFPFLLSHSLVCSLTHSLQHVFLNHSGSFSFSPSPWLAPHILPHNTENEQLARSFANDALKLPESTNWERNENVLSGLSILLINTYSH